MFSDLLLALIKLHLELLSICEQNNNVVLWPMTLFNHATCTNRRWGLGHLSCAILHYIYKYILSAFKKRIARSSGLGHSSA